MDANVIVCTIYGIDMQMSLQHRHIVIKLIFMQVRVKLSSCSSLSNNNLINS